MICIEAIGSYIPSGRISNLERKEQFGIDETFIAEKLGVTRVSRKARDEETSDLCLKAWESLKAKTGQALDGVECLIVCTQNPDGEGIPHTSAIVHGRLELPESCACFDISLGCSGYVYSLSIVKAFMEANRMRRALLFTADPYSKIIDPNDKNTSLLFGDAATVTVLQDKEEGWFPRSFVFATKGKDAGALHNNEEYLFMNGRQVFNFSAQNVPLQIRQLLEREGRSLEDVDLFLFHQGSKFIVDQLKKRLDLSGDKVPFRVQDYGNTVSSSIPLLLEEYLPAENMKSIVISGFGVGLSWASCLLTKTVKGEHDAGH